MLINFNETYDFGGELQVLRQYMQKQEFKTFGTSFKSFPFLSFMVSFQKLTKCWP